MRPGAALMLVLAVAVVAAEDRMVVTPAPDGRVLLNPGKGWVLYGTAEGQDPAALAIGTIGYQRFTWAELEPVDGQPDWTPLERTLEGWAKRGKGLAFGVMCANSHAKTPYVTPRWVFDAGAAVRLVDLTAQANPYAGSPGLKAVPDFADPVFLDRLGRFLSAMGRRFDGDPRIAFIDIRSYGNWGEGHLHPFGGTPLTPEQFRRHVQLHREAFPRTRLCISAEAKEHASVYDWAVEQGIAVRRDGICGNSDGRELVRGIDIVPAVFEFYGNYTWMKEKGWWDGRGDHGHGHRLEDCVERGRPSYIGLSHGGKEAVSFLAAERPLIDRLANRMGYHLAVVRAELPRRLGADRTAGLSLTWRNDGVAPPFVPLTLAIGLRDERQVVAADWPAADPHRWASDRDTVDTLQVTLPAVPAGRYRWAVALVATHGSTTPVAELAQQGRSGDGWYDLAEAVVE